MRELDQREAEQTLDRLKQEDDIRECIRKMEEINTKDEELENQLRQYIRDLKEALSYIL
jgi:LPS O-antigen subunit length determinant protein (WzzB/FepE family)